MNNFLGRNIRLRFSPMRIHIDMNDQNYTIKRYVSAQNPLKNYQKELLYWVPLGQGI